MSLYFVVNVIPIDYILFILNYEILLNEARYRELRHIYDYVPVVCSGLSNYFC